MSDRRALANAIEDAGIERAKPESDVTLGQEVRVVAADASTARPARIRMSQFAKLALEALRSPAAWPCK